MKQNCEILVLFAHLRGVPTPGDIIKMNNKYSCERKESSLKHFPYFWSWQKFVFSMSAAVFKGSDFNLNGAL